MYYKNPGFSVVPDIGCILHGNHFTDISKKADRFPTTSPKLFN